MLTISRPAIFTPLAALLVSATLGFTATPKANAAETWEPAYIGSDPELLYLPDAYATYWRYGIERMAGEKTGFVLRGHFPDARYFSYNVYDDELKQSVGSITDFEIIPDDGASNPFTGDPEAKGGTYTIYIVPEGVNISAKNVLTFPGDLAKVSIFLRHYLPEGGVEGGVPVPLVYLYDGAENVVQTAPPSTGIPALSKVEAKRYLMPMFEKLAVEFKKNPDAVIAQLHARDKDQPLDIKALVAKQVVSGTFKYAKPGQVLESYRFQTDGTYPNKDNLYLVMPVVRNADDALLVKFRAADVAESPAEYPSAGLRYASIGQGDDATFNYVSLYDKQMKVSDDGFVYLIISDDEAAMRAKAKSMSANFMPWKVGQKMLLVYRHMLPRADYAFGIDKVPGFVKDTPEAGQEGRAHIGDYAPIGKLMDKASVMASDGFPQF